MNRRRKKSRFAQRMSLVRKNLSGDTPKYQDKAIKQALLNCASQYALHGNKTSFKRLSDKLPNGIWKNRLVDFSEYVLSHDRKWVRANGSQVHEKLESISKIVGYQVDQGS